MNIVDLFIEFLKKEGVFEKYLANAKSVSNNVEDLKRFLKDFNICDYPFLGFSWRDSEEGFDFWNGIAEKWNNYVMELLEGGTDFDARE